MSRLWSTLPSWRPFAVVGALCLTATLLSETTFTWHWDNFAVYGE